MHCWPLPRKLFQQNKQSYFTGGCCHINLFGETKQKWPALPCKVAQQKQTKMLYSQLVLAGVPGEMIVQSPYWSLFLRYKELDYFLEASERRSD